MRNIKNLYYSNTALRSYVMERYVLAVEQLGGLPDLLGLR